MSIKMRILTIGIGRKLERGEVLENILNAYINLSEEEKTQIRCYFAGGSHNG